MRKGQSEVISYVLVVAIVVITATAAYFWAYPHVKDLGESAKAKSLTNQFKSLDDVVSQVSHGEIGFMNSFEMYMPEGNIRLDEARNKIIFTFNQNLEAVPSVSLENTSTTTTTTNTTLKEDWWNANYIHRRNISNSDSSLILPVNGSSTTDMDNDGTSEMFYGVPYFDGSRAALYYNESASEARNANNDTELCLFNTMSGRKACPNQPNGLTSFWTLDENTPWKETWDPINANNGTFNGANDGEFIGANDGTLNGGVTQGATGKINTAYDFDGTDDTHVHLGYGSCPTDWTFTGWVNYDVLGGILISVDGNDGFFFRGVSDGWDLYAGNSYILDGVGSSSTGNWHFVVITQSSDSWEAFIDGSSIGSGSGSYVCGTDWFSGIKPPAGGRNAIDGQVDDLRIYDRALNQSEIQEIYNSNSGTEWGPRDGLTGQWRLNEESGSTAFDSSRFTDGQVNKGYQFDGSDDYVEIPDDSAFDFTDTENFTVSLWVNHDSISGGADTYLEKGSHGGNDGDPNWQVKYSDSQGGLDFTYNDGSWNDVIDTSGFTPDLDTWYHVTFVVDTTNGEVSFYRNGNHLSTVSDPLDIATNNYGLYMGMRGSLDAEKLNGSLDDVRIYNRALNSSEIEDIYNGGDGTEWGPRDGLVGQWRLNEDSGSTAFDSSCFTDGQVNKGYQFDGSDDYVEIPDDPSLRGMTEITLSTWVKSDMDGTGRAISKWISNDDLYALYAPHSDGGIVKLAIRTEGDQKYLDSSTSINDGSWHHVTATWDGTSMKIYIDGDLDNSTTSGVPSGELNTEDVLEFGRYKASDSEYLDGSLDDVRVYNRSLTSTEIEELYNGSKNTYLAAEEDQNTTETTETTTGGTLNATYTCNENTTYLNDTVTGIIQEKQSTYGNLYKGSAGPGGTAQLTLCYPNTNLTWRGQCIRGKSGTRTSVLIQKQDISPTGQPIVTIDFC